jgi:L-fuculose-phosphate aldolase
MAGLQRLKTGIIRTGRRLARRGLVTARAGNISCRLDAKRILITASGSALGELSLRDIVEVELRDDRAPGPRRNRKRRDGPVPSTELPLHRQIYLNFPDPAVVHCHPALINAYFCIYPELKYLTFESRYYLGAVPVVGQKTLTVTDTQPVIDALRSSGLVVIRNHGVFSRGASLQAALERIEILEEAVRVFALARLFGRKKLDALDRQLKMFFSRTK